MMMLRATTICGLAMLGIAALTVAAQQSVPQWQIAAGGKMSFEVASVKQDRTPPTGAAIGSTSNVSIDPLDCCFTPTGGYFWAKKMQLLRYVMFAYKLSSAQVKVLGKSAPKWTDGLRFDIEAHAPAGTNPSKDQYRLMMQALLADRFKMKVHWEMTQMPVLAMVLVKPGKLGPNLKPHSNDVPCPGTDWRDTNSDQPTTVAGGFPEECGDSPGWAESGLMHVGGRDLDLPTIASMMTSPVFGIDRPVLDKTGLTGKFDYLLEYTPPLEGQAGFRAEFSKSGPTFLDALRTQLGIKLVRETDPFEILVIDRIEMPTPN